MQVPVLESEIQDPRVEGGSCIVSGIELCQLAALVYIERVAGSFLEDESRTNQSIERAFSIFVRLEACERMFPLLIFACEARNDDQRITILDLIARTQKNSPVRSLDLIKSMIQSIWVQDDLADQEIRYVDRLSITLSSSEGFPIFV